MPYHGNPVQITGPTPLRTFICSGSFNDTTARTASLSGGVCRQGLTGWPSLNQATPSPMSIDTPFLQARLSVSPEPVSESPSPRRPAGNIVRGRLIPVNGAPHSRDPQNIRIRPYPCSHRGRRQEPWNLLQTVHAIMCDKSCSLATKRAVGVAQPVARRCSLRSEPLRRSRHALGPATGPGSRP